MSDLESNNDAAARRDVLLKVYGVAIDELRFNINLGWDRTKFFLLLNSGLIAAGVGLIKVAEGSPTTSLFLVLYFILLLVLTLSGLRTVNVAKGFYREAVFTKTAVERELGLLAAIPDLPHGHDNLSIAVTDGQRDFLKILSGEHLREASTGGETLLHKAIGLTHSITATTEGMFVVMVVIEVFGAIIAVASFISNATA